MINGPEIRALRTEAGLTQEELGALAEPQISKQYVSDLECGRRVGAKGGVKKRLAAAASAALGRTVTVWDISTEPRPGAGAEPAA